MWTSQLQLNDHSPLELETICLKCLEKDPRRLQPGRNDFDGSAVSFSGLDSQFVS